MISKDEIKKLADLARIEIKEEELESLRGEIDSILEYVKLVRQFHAGGTSEESRQGSGIELGPNYNVMREDGEPNETGAFTKELLAEMPETENGLLKVKKILG